MMRRIGLMCAMALISGAAMAQMAGAPGPTGPAAEAQRGYAGLKVNILKSADIMPADGYSFKPTPEVRAYARILNHISEAQLHTCGAVNGTKDLAKVPAETADKAAVIDALNASFAECDKAYASLTDTNLTDMFALGNSKRSRVGLLWGNVSHDNEQYSALAMYLRLKNLVPPSSEK
jgi:hypothetical protein